MRLKRSGLLTAVVLVLLTTATNAGRIEEYKEAIKLDPKNPDNHYNLGVLYLKEGQLEPAAAEFREVCKLNKKDKESLLLLYATQGRIFFQQKKFAEAAAELEKALAVKPTDEQSLRDIALSYYYIKDVGKAIKYLRKYTELNPNDHEALYNLGCMLMESGDEPKAVQCYETCLKLKPDYARALEAMAKYYLKNQQFEKSQSYLLQANRLKPGDPTIMKYLAMSYQKLGDYGDAIKYYRQADEKAPNDTNLLYNYALAYLDNYEYDKAMELFSKILSVDPGDKETQNLKARTMSQAIEYYREEGTNYMVNGDYLKAKACLNNIDKMEQGNKDAEQFRQQLGVKIRDEVNALYKSGQAALAAGRGEEAQKDLQQAAFYDPENEKVKAALAQARAKVQRRLSDSSVYYRIGAQAFNSQDFLTARDNFQKALDQSPGDAKIREKLDLAVAKLGAQRQKYEGEARRLQAAGRLREAISACKAARDAAPTDQSLQDFLFKLNSELRNKVEDQMKAGLTAFQAGRDAEAKAAFSAVLALDPSNAAADDYIKKLTGAKSQSAAQLEEAKKLYYQGVNQYVGGDLQGAIATWQKVLALDPNHVNASQNIKKAQAKQRAIKQL